jgi:dihydroorotase
MVYKNCKLLNGDIVDIEVKDGIIKQISSDIKSDEFKDLKNAYILPRIVDLNVRLKDGVLNAKNIKKVASEAKEGGVGHIVLLPDSTPSIDDEVVLEFTQNTIKDIKDVKVDIAINSLKEDLSLSNIAILLKKGSVAPYMSTFAKNNIAIKVAEYVKMYKTTLFVKAEDNSLKSQGVMFEGDVSSKLGLAGIPELSEVAHVSRMIEIARYYDISILFKAISSPRSLEMIQKAKEEDVDVKAEVSLHHLIKSDKECEGFNTIAKIDPPLVEESLRIELIKALKDSKIDILTILHQPSSPVNKEVAFFDASYGSSSLKDALALYYTKLVKSGIIDFKELITLCVKNPLKLLNKDIKLTEGEKIDKFLAFDINQSYKVNDSNSLYNGEEIFGKIIQLG